VFILLILAWQRSLFQHYLPDVLCFAIVDDADLPPEQKDKKMINDDVRAYICEGLSCQQPLTELNQFQAFINTLLNRQPSVQA